MLTKSIIGNSPEEIQAALTTAISDGFKPTLAIVFVSAQLNRDELCAILGQEGIAIYGATSNAEFIDEDVNHGGAAILLLDMKPSNFMVLMEDLSDKDGREVTKTIARKALEKFAHPAFLIAGSHLETDAEQLLFGFEDIIGKKVNVFGAMAGDDFKMKETFVFTNQQSSNRGIVVVVLDEDKVKIRGRATCGWKAAGTEKIVTRSEGNRVYTIDDMPALDISMKFGGYENIIPGDSAMALELATNLPLQLQRESGDPIMRPGLVIDWDDHSFICSGSVPQGARIKFSLPPDFDVIEKVIQGCEELKASEMPEADALIIYSCAGRFYSLGPMISQEIEGVKNVWKVPMAGFFSNAELARATNGNLEMHNITTCCVALKEI